MRFASLLLWLCLALPVSAKKMFYPITVMIGSADLIVIGEIESVRGKSYDFKILDHLKGSSEQVIRVKMFEEWTCDRRFAKAKAGQRLLLFLERKGGTWQIINGGTGERPILDDSVRIHPLSESKESIPLSEAAEGIIDFARCYSMIGRYDPWDAPVKWKLHCPPDQVADSDIKTFRDRLFAMMAQADVITAQ